MRQDKLEIVDDARPVVKVLPIEVDAQENHPTLASWGTCKFFTRKYLYCTEMCFANTGSKLTEEEISCLNTCSI